MLVWTSYLYLTTIRMITVIQRLHYEYLIPSKTCRKQITALLRIAIIYISWVLLMLQSFYWASLLFKWDSNAVLLLAWYFSLARKDYYYFFINSHCVCASEFLKWEAFLIFLWSRILRPARCDEVRWPASHELRRRGVRSSIRSWRSSFSCGQKTIKIQDISKCGFQVPYLS